MTLVRQEWLLAFLIGLAAVMAALFGWRAAQIGSTAAFDDRQSIGATVAVQEQQVEVDIATADDAAEYARYLGDYAVAATLDRRALTRDPELAASLRDEAAGIRRAATLRAADAGVFGASSIAADLASPSTAPRTFDVDAHRAALAADLSTRLQSGGTRNPQASADAAEEIRDRVDGLVRWAFMLFAAVLLLTAADVWRGDTRLLVGLGAAGVLLLVVGIVGGLGFDFFESTL